MTKKRLDERRKRNQELAAMDASNRCAYCKKALTDRYVQHLGIWGLKFCSTECGNDYSAYPGIGR